MSYKKFPKEQRYGFVYIWRDRKHNRYYIGGHWGHENDGYVCSSNWMYNSYKRRKNDFKRKILFRCKTQKELWDKEYQWLCLIPELELGKKYYNLCIQHNKLEDNHIVSEATKKKMSENNAHYRLGKIGTRKGVKLSEEIKEKMRQASLGKKKSEEHATKIKNNRLGKLHTEETKEKIRIARLGKLHSEETKEKMRIARRK